MYLTTNLSSMTSQRHFNQALVKNTNTSERIASGLRINHAGDDSAGLAITQRLESSIRGINKSIISNNQSITFLQTADQLLEQQSQMLQRMREITLKSMSGTQAEADRAAMQVEVSQLIQQFDLTAQQQYNNEDIFGRNFTLSANDGSLGSSTINKYLKSKNSDRVARQSYNYSQTGANQEALVDGEIVMTDKAGKAYRVRGTVDADDQLSTANQSASAIAKAKAINEHSSATGVFASAQETNLTGGTAIQATHLDSDSYLKINGQKISGFTVQENDADGSLLRAINSVSSETGVTAHLSQTNEVVLTAEDGRNIEVEAIGDAIQLGFSARTVVSAGLTLRSTQNVKIDYADEFVDAKLGYIFNTLIPLNPGTASSAHSTGSGWQFISEAAGANYVAPQWQGHLNNNIILSGTYNGDINPSGHHRFHIEVDTDNGGVYLAALAAEDANGESSASYFDSIAFDPNGQGTYIFASTDVGPIPTPSVGGVLHHAALGSGNKFIFKLQGASLVDSTELDGDGIDAFQFTAPVGDLAILSFAVGVGYDETVSSIDVSTDDGAKKALHTIDLALGELSQERNQYGALMNRFEMAIKSLESSSVSSSLAQSRIKDADFASEMTQLTQTQLIQQAASSILSQANSQPSVVLSLVRK